MLRSMYSGVAGMKSHQTKMDVIGNNIANVNTYGFKGSRTTFAEVYYQTTSAAKGATANSGGTNASQIGYGSSVSGIDLLMTRSGFQSTDKTTDVAIAGEGFFQVADADGNKYYTRAGNFTFDSAGNLVDSNGNFVLGVNGSPLGQAAASDRITINIASVDQAQGSLEETIHGKKITISSSNYTEEANVSFSFATDATMPDGQTCIAKISNGIINVYFNPSAVIANETDLNNIVNNAITAANGNVDHPGGRYSISIENADWGVAGLTGAELVSTNYKPVLGSVDVPASLTNLGVKFSTVGNTFSGTGTVNYSLAKTNPDDGTYTITATTGNGRTYTGIINASSLASGTVLLSLPGGDPDDTITLTHPGITSLKNTVNGTVNGASSVDAVASVASKALGLATKQLKLTGGTVGGAQSVSDLTNISIGSDGVITATHAVHGLIEIGRIDIATFENPSGLIQAGTTYFQVSANSGDPQIKEAGTSGAGSLQSNSLEMSNVDLSTEFADMITTQRGFQASSRLITVSDEILQELVNLKR